MTFLAKLESLKGQGWFDNEHDDEADKNDQDSSYCSDDDSSNDDADDDDSSFSGEDDGLMGGSDGDLASSLYTDGSADEAARVKNDNVKDVVKMIRKESHDVDMWREIVTGMLVITAAMVTVTTYVVLSRQEVQEFAGGFNDLADNVRITLQYNEQTLLESFRGISDVMTSFANGVNATWPLVTIPDFQVHASHLITLTNVASLWSIPLVTDDKRVEWESYVQEQIAATPIAGSVEERIYQFQGNPIVVMPSPVGNGPFAPVWQMSPGAPPSVTRPDNELIPVNWDTFSFRDYYALSRTVAQLNESALSDTLDDVDPMLEQWHWQEASGGGDASSARLHGVFRRDQEEQASLQEPKDDEGTEQCPTSAFLQPIFDTFQEESRVIVGYLLASFDWARVFQGILPEEQNGIDCVLSTCHEDQYTWTLNGQDAVFRGKGDLHDELYGKYNTTMYYAPYSNLTAAKDSSACIFSIDVYPSQVLRDSYRTNKPAIYTACVGAIFFLMAFTFLAYDNFVKRRNDKIIDTASRSHAILASLFPSQIRDRLFDDKKEDNTKDNGGGGGWTIPKTGLKSFLLTDGGAPDGEDHQGIFLDTKPLADLFPECTVLFADLVGFTAWSSVREPTQVFMLLETLYRAMDQIAKRRRIFKVETVGDCYVAVSGLPEPRKDHAVAMVRFARDCVYKVGELTNKLETSLGPDTADLTVRIGIHSGPVTAGVLRGEKSRFQLFGDTVNTAARMESTGKPKKIQISPETATLINAAGKGHWLTPREDVVEAKGKGKIQTYFVTISASRAKTSSSEGTSSQSREGESQVDHSSQTSQVQTLITDKTTRLIEWNVDVLLRLLNEIAAHRQVLEDLHVESSRALSSPPREQVKSDTRAFDEVQEIISLPAFNPEVIKKEQKRGGIELDGAVADQLRNYVTNIAVMYNDNPFHNFEHASHVTMSVTKLLARIVAPSDVLDEFDAESPEKKKNASRSLHDHTYGITSDPLTQFSCVFSALIHDCDHQGVPNTQLCKENKTMAEHYENKSVAEQNSLDLSWNLLMDNQFSDLRAAIYTTEAERQRFRQLVVNSVMATDIMDKELKTLRNARWAKAFSESAMGGDDNPRDAVNRKATIVIEHLIQASDVAHTMQHWHVFRKWNTRLFEEMYTAYQEGRAEKNPADFWYEGEIGFFDFYIIPLARKLKDCGVFGVSSDEYLNYAEKNRAEWELKGKELVSGMVESMRGTAKCKLSKALGTEFGARCSEQAVSKNTC